MGFIEHHIITYYPFVGSTEREILKNFEDIIERALPLNKVACYYKECSGAAKEVVLNYVTFFEERKLVGACDLHNLFVLHLLCLLGHTFSH